MNYAIPFNRPCCVGNEYAYIAETIAQGHISGDGVFTKRCQAYLQDTLGARAVLLTTSGTHALELAALLLDLQPGDEVILPSFTFVSTANAFALRGAKPIFVDIRPDTLNLDESQLERALSSRTRAIVPVHYAGVACEMDVIMETAGRHGILVIEDNAHGLFGRYKGKELGTFGCLAAQSFHETKNYTSGEGGALLVNDARYLDRAEILREKGTDRSRFFRGQVDKYTWIDLGSSYLPSDILAAFLYAQLEAREKVQEKRRHIWEYYARQLQPWAQINNVRLPIIPSSCEQPYHMFYLLLPSIEHRQGLIAHLRAHSILSVFHYQPLHLSPMGLRYGYRAGACPITERVSDCLLRLPFYNDLATHELERIVEAVCSFRCA